MVARAGPHRGRLVGGESDATCLPKQVELTPTGKPLPTKPTDRVRVDLTCFYQIFLVEFGDKEQSVPPSALFKLSAARQKVARGNSEFSEGCASPGLTDTFCSAN